jgi:L-serine dehydratase
MAAISIFDIFKIGIGPSSSHTVGPMKAARAFANELAGLGSDVSTVEVTLHGSLAYTGKGHGTDSAVILGLAGAQPETIDPKSVQGWLRTIREEKRLEVPGIGAIEFDPQVNLVFNYDEELPRHTNGMRFRALGPNAEVLLDEVYYSLGGGFIARGDEPEPVSQSGEPRHYFDSSQSLLQLCCSITNCGGATETRSSGPSMKSGERWRAVSSAGCEPRACCPARWPSRGGRPSSASALRRGRKRRRSMRWNG